jgi:hypothetical protein
LPPRLQGQPRVRGRPSQDVWPPPSLGVHGYEVNHICDVWKAVVKKRNLPLACWDDGVDGLLVCQLLFGVSSRCGSGTGKSGPLWDANLVFRCGHPSSRHKKEGRQQARNDGADEYCHKQSKAHYRCVLTESDLRAPDNDAKDAAEE